MRWRKGRRSSNVEDRRGAGGGFGGFGGLGRTGRRRGGVRLPVRIGKRGGLLSIVVVLVALYLGVDPMLFLGGGMPGPGMQQQTSAPPRNLSDEERELTEFVSVVLADTEDTWHTLFQQQGKRYKEPKLVLFRGATRTACGFGQAAMGPFYCPADQKVYIDLSFYEDLKRRFGAPGDFAQAYVIAHEVGHHIQTLLGISQKVHSARRNLSKAEGNQLSVRQELQADCLAGVWANHADKARNILEAGDIEEALKAAEAIGDDRLQRQTQGHVTPDSFTHGTSKQRMQWFTRGLDAGRMEACDTFSAANI